MSESEKEALLEDGLAVWMFVDGKLAGECFGTYAEDFPEDDEFFAPWPASEVYCYGTTILPEFQGLGLAKQLVAFWNGIMHGMEFKAVTGHATSDRMLAVRKSFGAEVVSVTPEWYGTKRIAYGYRQPL